MSNSSKRIKRHSLRMLALSLILHLLIGANIYDRAGEKSTPVRPRPMLEVALLTQAAKTAETVVPRPEQITRNPPPKALAPVLPLVRHADEFVPLKRKHKRLQESVRSRNREPSVQPHLSTLRESAPDVAPVSTAPILAAVRAEESVEAPHSNANYLHNPKPAYPELAKRNGFQGRVLLRIRVDAEGRCELIEIEKSSGYEELDNSALAAAKEWRFKPARHGDEAITSSVTVPILFQIEG